MNTSSQKLALLDLYESISDYLLFNPSATNKQLSELFQRSPASISTIRSSVQFQSILREKRALASAALSDKLTNLSSLALDRMHEEISKPTPDPSYILAVGNLTLKSLGYGIPKASQTSIEVNSNHLHLDERVASIIQAQAEIRSISHSHSHSLNPNPSPNPSPEISPEISPTKGLD